MASFGNWVGAGYGFEYRDSWVGDPAYRSLVGPSGQFVQLLDPTIPVDCYPNRYVPPPDGYGEVPGLPSDHAAYEQVEQELYGPSRLNWESWTFAALRSEMQALAPAEIDKLADAWQTHGEQLQSESANFTKKVHGATSENWSGTSADAASAATQQVTKTSTFDFTPSSKALHDRLKALSAAFTSIQGRFPKDANAQLIDSGNFNMQQLDQAIHQFNSDYHLDGSDRLRNNSNGYVAAQQAVDRMNQINKSNTAYTAAVMLFQDTYNPAVEAVTNNFPNLPSPPDMTYGQSANPGTGTGSKFSSALPSGGGGLGSVAGSGATAIRNYTLPSASTTSQTPTTSLSSTTPATGTTSSTSGLSGTDALNAMSSLPNSMSSMASPLQSALGQAANAAQRGNIPTLPGAGGLGKLPEGALGLGPKGLKGGAGAGGGAGARALTPGKPAGAPATAAGTASARTVPAGFRAGLSGNPAAGAMGAPGAGAPAAGHQGGPGGPHQPSKALRRKKNGEQIIGDAQAVVAVLGEPSRPEAPKPEAP